MLPVSIKTGNGEVAGLVCIPPEPKYCQGFHRYCNGNSKIIEEVMVNGIIEVY
jgi:hypothetical protein